MGWNIDMNKDWSEQNKRMQLLIKKADTFDQGKPDGYHKIRESKQTRLKQEFLLFLLSYDL